MRVEIKRQEQLFKALMIISVCAIITMGIIELNC